MTSKWFPPGEREKPLRQRAAVMGAFPHFAWRVTRAGGLKWRGTLQPTPESPVYDVRIVHEPNVTPQVFVDRPVLRRDARHRYPDGSLCLYWPNEWRWSPRESLAVTTIPWAALWLYYYELWCLTGEWLGPSSPHGPAAKKEAA